MGAIYGTLPKIQPSKSPRLAEEDQKSRQRRGSTELRMLELADDTREKVF